MTLLKAFHQLFADDTTLFSVVNNVNESANEYRSRKGITLCLPVEYAF